MSLVKPKETTICGLAAVRGQFAADAGAIKRLFFDYDTGRKIGVMCKALAQAKKVYRCVEPAELEKIAGTIHHGGIVAVIATAELCAPAEGAPREWARKNQTLLVLDRIGNAHNLGAIARTTAFFGVPRLILIDDPAAALPSDAAHRVAEGGLAHLEVFRVRALPQFLRELAAAGYDVIGATTRGGRLGAAQTRGKPVALVVGNEEFGLSAEVAAACTRLVTIPGCGKVESLNVSVAAAVLMWELIARG
jgi:TrmH RNA methyltransferase